MMGSVLFKPFNFLKSLSFVGLVVASIFFALSVTPSLLPRTFFVQGILSGVAIAVGYVVGVGLEQLYRYLEIPCPAARIAFAMKLAVAVGCTVMVSLFVSRIPYWQNSIRELMEMPLVESAYVLETVLIALITGFAWIAAARGLYRVCASVGRWLNRLVPRRIANVLGSLLVIGGLLVIGNGLVWRILLRAADSFFLRADRYVGEGIDPPANPLATGSPESKIGWEQIGRQGKNYLLKGPTKESIEAFLGREAKMPIRVYAGMNAGETPAERAELALQELIRVGAFERSLLVIATPTGTGWLDPGAVDTLEYLHAGDCATVTTQYSYLPSWIAITVDPRQSISSAQALFDVVYGYWKSLPRDARPRLFLQGLSLGALGGEVSADLYTVLEDPIHGAVWSGPPFPSRVWNKLTAGRRPETPAWLPGFRDGRLVRFTSQQNTLRSDRPWGPIRIVYVQYASDPMSFFSPSLIYRKPEWLAEHRGPDVSPYLTWYPLITFLQIACDLPMATSIPKGYGHNFAPAHYIDAWIAVTEPKNWTAEDTKRLKDYFREKE